MNRFFQLNFQAATVS